MAKRTRRAVRPYAPKSPARTPVAPAAPAAPAAASAEQTKDRAAVTQSPKKLVDFAAEYRYVIADLKRIAVVAVSMLALLVVLALILT